MSFTVKMLTEDVSSGCQLASSTALKLCYTLGRDQQPPWCCYGARLASPAPLPSCFLLRSIAFRKPSPRSGGRREVGNAEGFAHVITSAPPRGRAALQKAWAHVDFPSRRFPSKPWRWRLDGLARHSFANCAGMSGTAPFYLAGGDVGGKQSLPQILLQGVGSAASSNRALASLPLPPGGPLM